jgi:hypothetical protein
MAMAYVIINGVSAAAEKRISYHGVSAGEKLSGIGGVNGWPLRLA